MKRAGWVLLAALLLSSCVSVAPWQGPKGAGFRHSAYGPPHDPGPDYWTGVGLQMAQRLDVTVPEAVWIVGRKNGDGTLLNFPVQARDPLITGDVEDKTEAALSAFDRTGYRVWLQVEPAHASVDELIDIVMTRYRHHPSVAGFGVDVEWFRSGKGDRARGEPITDAQAKAWVKAVRRHGPQYRLFLKHWDQKWMPPRYRDGLLFIDDSQILPNLEAMVDEFKEWGRAFAPAPVAFQIGYPRDRWWWIHLEDPPRTIGRAILDAVPNAAAVYWVDFTVMEAFPPPPRLNEASTHSLAERLGYAPDAKLLIVHADDLGMARSVDEASTRALETGLVNSASIMVPCPNIEAIAAWAKQHPDADLGIHLTLTSEWRTYRWGPVLPKTAVPSLVDENGFLHATETDAASRANVKEAEAEVRAQIERARSLGIRPTHFDNHMRTLHQTPELFGILLRVSRERRIPTAVPASFRNDPVLGPLLTPDDVVIDRFVTIGPDVPPEGWAEFYANVVRTLEPGVTELIVHLAFDDAEMQAVTVDHPNWGAAWRQRDFDYLTSDAFRAVLAEQGVKLVTWREIGEVMGPQSLNGARH